MDKTLKVLIVEDSEDDALLLVRHLKQSGLNPATHRVETIDTLRSALHGFHCDVILCDMSMPNLNVLGVLGEVKSAGFDIPFIIVSGSVPEERLVELMKAGAHDVIVKGQLSRLVPAIEREIADAAHRRERLEIEAQLAQAQKMEVVGQLTGGVAHDFNNLLTVILGNTRLLERRLANDDAVASKNLAAIAGAAKRGAGLIQRLLAFSRKEKIEPQVINGRELISGMLDMMRRTLGAKIEIEARFTDEPLNLLADSNLLEGAILNLATNARDAMPEGGAITIELGSARVKELDCNPGNPSVPGDYVVISVSDTGSGIPARQLARIFEPFFTTKEVGKGTGLGLSMVFGFAKRSGGHIKVESEVGRGTIFRLFLPAARGEVAAQPDISDSNTSDTRGHQTILVAEDEPGVRAIAVSILESLGYRVIESENGHDAMAKLDQHHNVDLLFTDIAMPGGMNGLDLATWARERIPGLKVLFTTGYDGRTNGTNDVFLDGANVLAKPYEAEALAEKVSQSLGALG